MTTTSDKKRRGSIGFRYEAEMIPVIRKSFPRLAFRHEADSAVQVFEEVPALYGVPDLTAVRFDEARKRSRLANHIQPLSTVTQVKIALCLTSGPMHPISIADNLRISSSHLRQNILPELERLGWIGIDRNGNVHRNPSARWVGKRIVTIEAKLKDWRSGVSQARRHQVSANATYIAIDLNGANTIREHLVELSQAGVGVITVDHEVRKCRVLTRPEATASQISTLAGRQLLAERCLEVAGQGKSTGNLFPVFGASLSSAENRLP